MKIFVDKNANCVALFVRKLEWTKDSNLKLKTLKWYM